MAAASWILALVLVAGAAAFPWPAGDNEVGEGEPIDLSYLGDGIYGKPKNSTGDSVAKWDTKSNKNPEELGEYSQGDILFPPDSKRNGIRSESFRWPDGIVPYVFECSFSDSEKDTIMQAIADFHRLTCLRFVAYKGQQKNYLAITCQRTGCWSSVGMIGGRQELNLQRPGCLTTKGTVIHEKMHAVGFFHEQSKPDRDDYVNVYLQNVKSSEAHNFDKAKKDSVTDFGVKYAYCSVMHYSEYAFSTNGKKTIEAKQSGEKLGQRVGFCKPDVQKINAMYKCNKGLPSNGWDNDVYKGSG